MRLASFNDAAIANWASAPRRFHQSGSSTAQLNTSAGTEQPLNLITVMTHILRRQLAFFASTLKSE